MIYPMWICDQCVDDNGGWWPPYHVATVHTGKCSVCGYTATVTEPRDFEKECRCCKRDLRLSAFPWNERTNKFYNVCCACMRREDLI